MALFDDKAPAIMDALMRDVGVTDFQAGGILGNIGHECAGMTKLHQIGGSAIGWAQWDGARKSAFAAWCARKGLDWQSDEANYRYLVLELLTSEKAALDALKATGTLGGATTTFEEKFERAGVPALMSRLNWAQRAMAAYAAAPRPIKPIVDDIAPPPKAAPLPPRQPDDPGVEPKPAPQPPAVGGAHAAGGLGGAAVGATVYSAGLPWWTIPLCVVLGIAIAVIADVVIKARKAAPVPPPKPKG